jgi:hypothetical protein
LGVKVREISACRGSELPEFFGICNDVPSVATRAYAASEVGPRLRFELSWFSR